MGNKFSYEAFSSPDELLSEIVDLKKKFDVIVNHTESVEIWVDAERNLVFISPGIEKISGYKAIEFMNDPGLFSKIIHPDDIEDFRNYYDKNREPDLNRLIDRRIFCKDGKIRWIHTHITPLFDEQGRYQGFRSSTIDITERKLSEIKLEEAYQVLRELEEKYRIVADNTYDMERWVLPDQTLAYISPSCKKITGYTQEEFYDKPELLMEIIHPDDRKWFTLQQEDSFSGEKFTERNRVRIISKDGEVKWIDITAQKVFQNDGTFIGFRTSSRDITHQKELEEELEAKSKLLSSISEDQPDMIIRTTGEGSILYINNSFAEFFGLHREAVTGRKYFEVIGPSDIEKINEQLLLITIDHPSVKAVIEYPRPGGEILFIEWIFRNLYNQEGVLSEQLGIGRDVTENILLNRKLQHSQALYKTVVNNQSELIVRHLLDSTIVFINDAFTEFTGAKREELLGMKWFDLVPVEVSLGIEKVMDSLTPVHPSASYEMANKRPDGTDRWISWISTGFFDSAGKLLEIQSVGRDVTQLKQATQNLESALAEVKVLKAKLELENLYLREKYQTSDFPGGIVTNSPLITGVIEKVRQVARTDAPVLLTGETGTGKELFAQAIHQASNRRNRLMITVNCAAMPESLIESELFGREKGAYTGALSSQIGRFEIANRSTIFLDEIGELPPEIQVKLLRIIQFGEYQMLGSPETKKVDVRIIAATNKDLTKAVADNSFRKDLFYRLNVFPIQLPPLRERKEDIPLLAWAFVDEIAGKMGKRIDKISTTGMNRLLRHSWPGNIRELRNVIEYSIILSQGPVLDIHLQEPESGTEDAENLYAGQKRHIEKVLNQTGWRIRGKGGAAEKLGMKESTLRFRMKKLGIERK
jgi:PAS domain S-box-containing protein